MPYLLRFRNGSGYLARGLFAPGNVATRARSLALRFETEAAAIEFMVMHRAGPLVEIVKTEEEARDGR